MAEFQEVTRASLIQRLPNADDMVAWDEFSEIYSPIVYRAAIKRGFQPADAENIIQEVFLAVAKSIGKWLERTDRGKFRAWLLRIARNETVDMLTRRATRPLGHDGSAAQQMMEDLTASNNLVDEIGLEYQKQVFGWASQKVQQDVESHTWAAFRLTSVDGMPVKEAAEKLGTKPGNIYFARSRVMARIKKLVELYEDSE